MGYHGEGSSTGDHSAAGSGAVKLRKQNGGHENTLSREYRNSIRSKCDDMYAMVEHSNKSSSLSNLACDAEGAVGPAGSSHADPLPTLMSSFRDKVKESSRTANTYREQRRNLQLGHYGSLDRPSVDSPPPASVMINGVGGGSGGELDRQEGETRRSLGDADLGDITLRLDDSLDSGVRSSKQGSTLSGSDDDHHHQPVPSLHPYYSHKSPGSLANSTLESESSSLPSIRENGQLSLPCAVTADKPPRQLGKMYYLSIDKAGHVYSRHLNIVPRTKAEIGRRDSANYSLTSSQETFQRFGPRDRPVQPSIV